MGKMYFLLQKVPVELALLVSEYLDDPLFATPHVSLSSYMDDCFEHYMRKGNKYSILSRFLFLLLFMTSWLLPNLYAGIVGIIISILLTLVNYRFLSYARRLWIRGITQNYLWRDYYNLRCRAFAQLRGFLETSVLGAIYDPEKTTYMLGRKRETRADNFMTFLYIILAVQGKVFQIALSWQVVAYHFVTLYAPDSLYSLESLPMLLVPFSTLKFYRELEGWSRKSGEHSHFHTAGFVAFLYFISWIFLNTTSEWALLLSAVIWFGMIYMVRFYVYLIESAFAFVLIFVHILVQIDSNQIFQLLTAATLFFGLYFDFALPILQSYHVIEYGTTHSSRTLSKGSLSEL